MAVRYEITRGTLGCIERAHANDPDLRDLLVTTAQRKRGTLWITVEDRYTGQRQTVYAKKGHKPPAWWL